MVIEKTEQLVIEWSQQRGIFSKSTPIDQMVKLIEEVGELARWIPKGNIPAIEDAIGDVMVVLTNIAHSNRLTLGECFTAAWNEIKDRRGEMVNGTFVKE